MSFCITFIYIYDWNWMKIEVYKIIVSEMESTGYPVPKKRPNFGQTSKSRQNFGLKTKTVDYFRKKRELFWFFSKTRDNVIHWIWWIRGRQNRCSRQVCKVWQDTIYAIRWTYKPFIYFPWFLYFLLLDVI